MGTPNQEFDRRLFTLKLSELSQQMQIKSAASDRKAAAEARKTSGSHLINIVGGQLALLREWLEDVDRICREVWQIQDKVLTPEFVLDVLLPEAFTVIEARKGSIMSGISLTALRTRAEDPHAAQSHLAREINALKSRVSTRYEIEARSLRHKSPKPTLPAPIRPVSTALTSLDLGSRDPTSEKTAQSVESKSTSRKPERGDPEVAKRAALVRSNPGTSAVEMCEIFDRASVHLPAKWQAAGLKTWWAAYKHSKYRSRIDTLISKDRRKG